MDLKPTDKTPNQHFEDGYESATLTIADHGVLFAKNYLAVEDRETP